MDCAQVFELPIANSFELFRGKEAHGGGVLHYYFVGGLASANKVGIDEFDVADMVQ